MADEDKASKTEQPTEKKLAEAHKKGQFAKAADINTFAVLVAVFLVFLFTWQSMGQKIGLMSRGILGNLHAFDFTLQNVVQAASLGLEFMAGLMAPLFLTCMVATIFAGGYQSKFRLTLKVFEEGFNKLNPVSGAKKLFSTRQYMQALIDLMKFVAVGVILYGAVREIVNDPIFFSPTPFFHLVEFMLESSALLMIRLIAIIGIIAMIHYIFERRKHTKDMMMTKQEVKDERKQAEGDPKVKAAMRQMAYRNLQKQMLNDVPTADVVVTNPTHFAVALKYEKGKDAAPVVLAKGEDAFARRIKAIAAEHGVPMVENKPVARLLYRVGQVGESIPYELYEVVAKILAHVYKTNRYYFHRLKSRRAAQGANL